MCNKDCGKSVQICIMLKTRLIWVFEIKKIRDNDNETCLKEGEVIEIETTSAMHALHSLLY